MLNDTPLADANRRAKHLTTAGWPGTGPRGMKCGHCNYLGEKNLCAKYRQLTGRAGGEVPASTDSCRYFDASRRGSTNA